MPGSLRRHKDLHGHVIDKLIALITICTAVSELPGA